MGTPQEAKRFISGSPAPELGGPSGSYLNLTPRIDRETGLSDVVRVLDVRNPRIARRLPHLPSDWDSQMEQLAASGNATQITIEGGTPGNLAPEGIIATMRMLKGNALIEALPWWDPLWREDLAELATEVVGEPMEASRYPNSGISMNLTTGTESLPLHPDSNPLAAVLYVHAPQPGHGGRTVFHGPEGIRLNYIPRSGDLVLFGGKHTPHEIEALTINNPDVYRISVQTSYYHAGEEPIRS